jgi:hypothetical protein
MTMDIRQIVEETLVKPMRELASRTVAQERADQEATLQYVRDQVKHDFDVALMHEEAALLLAYIDRQKMLADAYMRLSAKHERQIGALRELLDDDELDAARDLVRDEFLSIHGPSDKEL